MLIHDLHFTAAKANVVSLVQECDAAFKLMKAVPRLTLAL